MANKRFHGILFHTTMSIITIVGLANENFPVLQLCVALLIFATHTCVEGHPARLGHKDRREASWNLCSAFSCNPTASFG